MADYKGILPLIIETAKKKGVRFDIFDFTNEEIECINNDVVIFRGKGCDLINRLFHSKESCLPRKEVGQ